MKTIKNKTTIEFEEKKSKFIGYIKPVQTKKDAEDFIQQIKSKHKDATHNVSAYKLIENGQEYFKFDDDGEPSGTAGKPMGEILNLLEVNNLVVVATRYFGGIKLGAGGLVRNYAKTAKLSVQEAEITNYIEKNIFLIDFSYGDSVEVDNILNSSNESEIIEKNYGERVTYRIKISSDIEKQLMNIKDITIIKS